MGKGSSQGVFLRQGILPWQGGWRSGSRLQEVVWLSDIHSLEVVGLLSTHLDHSPLSFVLYRVLCVLGHRMCLRLGFFHVPGGLDCENVCYLLGAVVGWEG